MATPFKQFKQAVRERLESVRNGKLSQNTLSTYSSSLANLYKKVFGIEHLDMNKFNEVGRFVDQLKDMSPLKRRVYYCQLFVLTGHSEYEEKMKADIHEYTHWVAENKKTPQQAENWVTQSEVREKYAEMRAVFDKIKLKDKLSPSQTHFCVNFALLALLTQIPPRRALDYTEMKYKDYDLDKDNVYSKKGLVYNRYKTCKAYGRQVETPSTELKRVVERWIKIMKNNGFDSCPYLLFGGTGKKMINVQINQRLLECFAPKRCSVNILRHSFITEQYDKGRMTLNDMKELAADMGHSVSQQQEYVKT
jgi:hypothetical protein